MKKICIKTIFVIFIILFLQIFIFNINVYASIASISSSGSVNVGENFTVTLNAPTNSAGAQANIVVKYADGSTNSAVIAYTEGYGSKSVSFNAKAAGKATISATNIIISDSDGNALENGGSTSTSIQINSPAPVAPTTPEPSTPEISSTPVQPQTTPTQSSTPVNKTTPKEPNFTQTNETVYATKSMNVRSSWSTSSSKIGGLSAGQAVTRTGIGDNGWSRISYNGKTAYVSTGLITTTKPQPVETEQLEENIEADVQEEITNDVIEENVEKTEEQIYQEIVSEVGTIPEVGNNSNIYIYIIVLMISIISSIVILKK